ncbi:MAG: TraY domain-containing protein [Rhodospirillaceae bacterium]|nr:TraY domain-containing protein [Rhodospirillaceae bacterium]
MLAIRLPVEIEERLEKLAKSTGRTKSFYVRQAILEHLEELEDIYLAERVLEDIRKGKQKTASLAKVMKRHGMED